ncbi:acyl CoA synthetase, long chain fatty acid:CoA ligase [Legionella quinlivanii]|uniref:Acyl CoA synthetase, long chain fatty acid:CoA ligase n=1 Tax=Legionella quinlivanii TaxID=45073 RepID=A0A0W0XPS0_9GAMM|nr:class I adenylate-forming enzyme family protein [Legionella quinlivanii]KTD46532.1 acyl CoA synthetase, long chain fatty acid:CoA ligase [Legionella quinlivanii]SEG10070.1 long-chain acyl-CoA synthetase [Legionella quinlivanii DSM 21216]STY10220.1 acyl CoA synthetase, long chain fatty acid:CoA ligase [Legionella quinlivanii]
MLGILLNQSAAKFPDKIALITEQQQVTYSELHRLSNRLASSFMAENIKKEDCIAFLLPNCLEIVLTYYACFTMGAIALPVNINFDDAMISEVLAFCRARILITNAEFYQRLIKNKEALKHIEHCYLIQDASDYPETKDFKNLIIKSPSIQFPQLVEDDPALIYYTSGTTGLPKAVLHTHRGLMQGTNNQIEQIQINANDSTLVMFPLCYLIGLGSQILPFNRVGATIVLLSVFEPQKALKSIIENRITKVYGFPKLYLELLTRADKDYVANNALNFCFSGGEAIAPALQKRFKDIFNIEITEGCGMSELQIYCMNPPYGKKKLGSIGFPIVNVEMGLIDEKGIAVIKPHSIGEIIVKTASVTAGYWHNEELTHQIVKQGWFHTGDLAYRDAEGCYWFVSRKADIIKRSSLLISPLEIENVFYQNPEIKEAAAVALKGPADDQIIVFVLLKAEASDQTADSLLYFANQSLTKEKQVNHVRIVNQLPYGVTGKINRKELRQWANKYKT